MRTNETRRHFIRNAAIGTVAVGLSGWATLEVARRIQAGPRTTHDGIDADRVYDFIKMHADILDRDLGLVWNQADGELLAAYSLMAWELQKAGERFAEERITRREIVGLVQEILRDYFDGGSRADEWFESNLVPYLEPSLRRYGERVQAAVERFEVSLAQAMDDFAKRVAHELAKEGGVGTGIQTPEEILARVEEVFERRGIRFGLGMTMGVTLMGAGGGTAGVGLLVGQVARRVQRQAVRVLRPVVAKLVARLATAGVGSTVPPLGATLAVGGAVWTGVDVYRVRGQMQQAFREGLLETIGQMKEELNEEVRLPLVAALRKIQEDPEVRNREIRQGIRAN
jgi:hypothetical protein